MTQGRKGLYLLASYPKSGNTWVRTMLESWYEDGREIDINELSRSSGIMQKALFQNLLDIDPGELTEPELYRARPLLHRALARATDEVRWYKSHDANIPGAGAAEIPFPADILAGVVLIVRDPRDVAPSLAHHSGCSIDKAIDMMANESFQIGQFGLAAQLPQLVSSWSRFQESWLEAAGAPILVMRYEDILTDPVKHLTALLAFAGLDGDDARLGRAVDSTRFEVLQRQEVSDGFREYSPKAPGGFFRQGRAGSWRHTLDAAQVRRLEHDHGATMTRLGYQVRNPLEEETRRR